MFSRHPTSSVIVFLLIILSYTQAQSEDDTKEKNAQYFKDCVVRALGLLADNHPPKDTLSRFVNEMEKNTSVESIPGIKILRVFFLLGSNDLLTNPAYAKNHLLQYSSEIKQYLLGVGTQ